MKVDPKSNQSHHQEGVELAEALRVQAMSVAERSAWFTEVWSKLQRSADGYFVNAPEHVPAARCYASPEEKNRFDEARELEFAMRRSIYAMQKTVRQM